MKQDVAAKPEHRPHAREGVRSAGRMRRGFTIVELLVVLTFVSIVASVGIPAYFSRATITLDNAAKLLARDVREVQNRAALYKEPLRIDFAEEGTGYRANDTSGKALVSPYGDGDFQRHYPLDAVFRGVTIESVTTVGPKAVVFDSRGHPQARVEVVIAFQGETRLVQIHAGSGLISIDGLDEQWLDLGH